MRNPIRAFWDKVPSEDRRLIRRTATICLGVLLASLAGLYVYASYGPESPAAEPATNQDSAQDSAAAGSDDTTLPPPGADSLDTGLLAPGPLVAVQADLESPTLDSFDAGAHRELMRIAASKYDYTRSLAHGLRIAHLLEEDAEFLAELGHAYLEAGLPANAMPVLSKAMQKKPGALVVSDLALATYRSSNADNALALIKTALVQYPNHPQLLTHQAAMLGELPDTSVSKQAYPLFLDLVRQHPRFAEARYQFGRYLMSLGNMRNALAQLNVAVQLDPLNPRVHARLGMVQFYLEQDAAAENSYRTALAINPGDYNTWYNLGELYLSQANETTSAQNVRDKTRAALESYLAALALYPDLGPAHFRTGTILNGNNQFREAIRHLQAALAHDPHSVRILLQLATSWEQLGDLAKAMDYLATASAIDPFHKVVAANQQRLKKLAKR